MNTSPTSSTGAGTIRVEIVRSLQALGSFREEWNQLAFRSHQHLPVLSWAWVASFFEHCLRPGESWICLMAVDAQGRLVGVLPLISRPHRLFKWCRRLEVPSDPHTQSVDLLVAAGVEQEVRSACFSVLDQAVPNWFSLKLVRIPQLSPTLELIKHPPPGIRVIGKFQLWGSVVPTCGAISDYLSSWDAKHHRNIKRYLKKFNGLPGANTAVISGQDAAAERYLLTFLELEASGWKGENRSAILNSPERTSFYRQLTRRLVECGWLEWHLLEAEGKVVAANLAVRCGRALIFSKIAYHENYSEYAPGLVLRMNIIERAFGSADTDEINFLSELPAHDKWHMLRRAHYTLDLFPGRLTSLVFAYLPLKLKDGIRELSRSYPLLIKIGHLLRRSPSTQAVGRGGTL